jgi:hyaluronoglucosaminidase
MFSFIKEKYTFHEVLLFEKFHIEGESVKSYPSIDIQWMYEERLADQYQLHIYNDYSIRIRYGNERSKKYAIFALKELGNNIEVGVYEGGPDSKIRGIIEGFYGQPWSHEERLDVINFMETFHMNSFFYAPKDDEFHRALWRTPYPQKEMKNLNTLVQHANKKNIEFYFCISPGKDFDYLSELDYHQLYEKISQVLNIGVRHIAILFDDIDYQLNTDATNKFKRPGIAHSHVTNFIYDQIKKNHHHVDLTICPTEYYLNKDTTYIQDLKKHIVPEVIFFWTGYNTVAECIPNLDGIRMREFFGHPLLLWDNYPVNDMATHRLFLGPLTHRTKNLFLTHEGMVSNPMIQWHASKIPLITMALFMWDAHQYNEALAYEYALKCMSNHDETLFNALKTFSDEHASSIINITSEPLAHAIETNDLNQLSQYFIELLRAIQYLENNLNQDLLKAFEPWIKVLKADDALFNDYKLGKHIDVTKLKDRTYESGRNIMMKILKKQGYIDDDYFKPKRLNYWQQKEAQL